MNNENTAAKLIELGGDEWKKGNHHRVYVYSYVVKKFFNNENASFGKSHEVHFNTKTGKFFCSNKSVENNLNCLLDDIDD